MINCNFSKLIYETHKAKKSGIQPEVQEDFDYQENIWLSIYGLGKFEFYAFQYGQCRDFEHFKDWVIGLKGEDFVKTADLQFKKWQATLGTTNKNEAVSLKVLSPDQIKFWEENGYLRIPRVIDEARCDLVTQKICRYLNIHLDFPETWYMPHPDWQGIMLQVYQDKNMEAIRQDATIRDIFTDLYQTDQIIANTEKLGYNPPETREWVFGQGQLHWDLDWDAPVKFNVQALVYLNDVPVDRGPLQVVPGFNKKYDDWKKDFSSSERAHTYIRITETPVPVPGEKGDLIIWRNTIPHAAGKNQSALPRFVQYISFTKI